MGRLKIMKVIKKNIYGKSCKKAILETILVVLNQCFSIKSYQKIFTYTYVLKSLLNLNLLRTCSLKTRIVKDKLKQSIEVNKVLIKKLSLYNY